MAVKVYKPVTPGLRDMTGYSFEEITKSKPERSLIVALRKHGGRNSYGRVTVRHRGGGNRRAIRLVDFKREKRYIIAPLGLKVGDSIITGSQADIRPGNALPLANIPVGTLVHAIELKDGKGAQLVRAAGAAAQLLAKEGDYAQVRMPSGEVRLVRQTCYATIGQVGNLDHSNVKLGKAGRKRHMGIRPTVRGSAMTPRDHPHGGGEGRQPIGMPGPKTPWGKPTLGYKTRRNKKTDQYIVRRRSKSGR